MGVVQLDGDLVGQVLQRSVAGQMVLHDITDRSSGQEVLLTQAQDLALNMVVVGVQHLGDELGVGVLAHGGVVVAQREAGHIKVRSLCLPQTQLCNALSIVALHIHIGGNGHDAVVVGVLDVVEAVVPVAVLVQDGVAGAADIGGGHAVQIAGCQTAQTTVAQACIRLFLKNAVQIDVGIGQCLLGHLVQTQIEQAHLQAAAHQKLHAEVVDLLGAGADGLGLELFVVLAHHLTADQSQRTVDLLVGGNIQLHTVLTGELVLKNFAKFF